MGRAFVVSGDQHGRVAFGFCAALSALLLTPAPADAQFYSSGLSYSERVRPRVVRPAATSRREPTQVAAAKAQPAKQESQPAPYPLLAVISVGAQRVSIYDKSGSPVITSPVSTGQAGHRTPMGIFSVIQKNRHHHSNIYSGAPMPYMQRITWSGIAFHEGHLPGYPASHGCIRMPGSIAAKLFGMTKIGMRVVIAPHDVTPNSFSHAALFEPLMTPAQAPAPPAQPQRSTDAGNVRLAAGEPNTDAAPPGVVSSFQNPHQRAVAARAAARAAHAAAIQAQRTALDNAQRASAEANQASLDLRAAQAQETAAQSKLAAVRSAAAAAVTPEALAIQQQGLADAETAVADMRRLLTEAESQDEVLSKLAYEAAKASRDADEALEDTAKAARLADKAVEPVSVFISRKEGKLFVRQGFEQMFDAPVTFKGDAPLGTHLFVAMDADNGSGRLSWTSVTVPNSHAATANVDRGPVRRGQPAPPPEPVGRASTPAEALSRVEMSPELRQRINERVWLGASLIVSDLGISNETGKGTDFIVLTK